MLNNDSVDTLPGNWTYLSIPPYTVLRLTVSNLIDIMIKIHDYACLAIILILNTYAYLQNKYFASDSCGIVKNTDSFI